MAPLDIEDPRALLHWLRARRFIEPDEIPSFRVLAGGVSNRTVRVERPSGEIWVLKQPLAKLRVTVEWYSHPDRVHREALGMQWLQRLVPPDSVPRLVFEDRIDHVIAMTGVPEPHENWKSQLLTGIVVPGHVIQFAKLLGSIHHNSSILADSLPADFRDRSFFEALRLEPFYEFTAAQVPKVSAFLRRLAADTRVSNRALVHGDFSPKNILVHQNRLMLVDHEVIHWGDPLFDVGFALAHLLSKAHHLPESREALGEGTLVFWNEYRETAGESVSQPIDEERAVQHTLGCLMARAAGRSQLEYLNSAEKDRQRRGVARVIAGKPARIEDMVEAFLSDVARDQG